jgi:hypothetical protein
MTDRRQQLLNNFKQGHLLEAYDKLTPNQQDALTAQLSSIHFDVIDLVRIHPYFGFLKFSYFNPLVEFPQLGQKCRKISTENPLHKLGK